MTIKFVGTRGNTNHQNKAHRLHASVIIRSQRVVVCIDTADGKTVEEANELLKHPNEHVAFFITHWHPDHIEGLEQLSPHIPLFAPLTEEVKNVKFSTKHVIELGNVTVTAFPVRHTKDHRIETRAYRIDSPAGIVVYAPDIFSWQSDSQRRRALKDATVYIGDGAHPTRDIGGEYWGHASMLKQIRWVWESNPNTAIVFTHFGDVVIKAGDMQILRKLKEKLGEEAMAKIELARDGLLLGVGRSGLQEMRIDQALQVDLSRLDKVELLILHLRCHQLYRAKNVSERTRKMVWILHQKLVQEFRKRGIKHNSPLR